MNEIDPLLLGRQLMKPTGEAGKQVGEYMNTSNKLLYDFVLKTAEFQNNSRVLEIGFGNGKLLPEYFKHNVSLIVTGLDFSEEMCAEAKINNQQWIDENKLSIVCEDSSHMSFPDNAFQLVTAINTVYFWTPVEKYLNEIYRVLKSGGQLFLGFRPKSVMNALPFAQEVFALYEPDELKVILSHCGFINIEIKKQLTERKSVDGSFIKSLDICMIAEKQ
jgi:ubiquinone/menaquinone biosynthesis C-methylase UbiE